jgi:glutaredoxin
MNKRCPLNLKLSSIQPHGVVCVKKAKKFLKERGLAFIELDVEKNEEAARELKVKSERANIPLGSVPVIDVGGTLMRGFDPERLMSMLGRDRK